MINEKNFFAESKKINVSNTSSLVNLKAELFKKKQDAIKGRSLNKRDEFEKVNATKNVSNSKWNQKAIQLDQKIRESIRTKTSAQLDSVEDANLERELKKSKESLERKSKIYEEKLKSAYDSLLKGDEEKEDEDNNLVDFERKIIASSKEELKLIDAIQTSSTSDQIDDPEEMVEYQDSFGRTRYCKRKHLDKMQKLNDQDLLRRKLDRDLSKIDDKSSESNEPTKSNLYPDLYSCFVKPAADQNEQESDELHYQSVSKDEIREHGTSYYQFSLNQEKRKQQMQELDKLRNQTVEQRKKADEKLEKRNLALKQRLLKLAKRKGLVDEEDLFDTEEVSEKMKLDQYIKNVPKSSSNEDATISTEDDRSIEMKDKKLREWDKGKFDQFDYIIDRKGSITNSNAEQDSESSNEELDNQFAPPSYYESKTNNRKRFKGDSNSDDKVEDKIDDFLNQFCK